MGVGPSTCRCRDMTSVQVQVVASADRKFVLNETYMAVAGLKQLCCLQICLMQPRQGTVSSTSNLYYTGVHGGF